VDRARIEQVANSTVNTAIPERGGAESGAAPAESTRFDRDLEAIVLAWPKLSPKTKAAILTIIQSAQT
jgi:hypothetical protein